jgi:hypothetical protein
VAQQTAEVYEKVFNERKRFQGQGGVTCCGDLTPETTGSAERLVALIECSCDLALQARGARDEVAEQPEVLGRTERVVRQLNRLENSQGDSGGARRAYVLVGHQPQLTHIARRLLNGRFRRFLPGDSLPIGNSEVACIELGSKSRRLPWVLTQKPAPLLEELKDKIKSKYDVAKFFLGAFVVNTGLILNAGIWGQPESWATAPIASFFAYAAIVVAMVSLLFTAITLFSYDSLVMPETFWSEPSEQRKGFWRSKRPWSDGKPPRWSVSRPPSQAHVILYYEMMHVWNAFSMPAVSFAFVALGCLVLALICRGEACLPFAVPTLPVPGWTSFVVVTVILGLSLFFYWWNKPRLGTED